MASHSKKLLIADDSLTIQKVIRLALASEGYEIQAVSDGDEAAEQMALFQPDAMIIDFSLPKKSAFELKIFYDQLTTKKTTEFVLMSSAYEEVDEEKAKALGFQGRLVKPFDPGHLRTVLNQVLKKKDPVSIQPPQEEITTPAPESTIPVASSETSFNDLLKPVSLPPEEHALPEHSLKDSLSESISEGAQTISSEIEAEIQEAPTKEIEISELPPDIESAFSQEQDLGKLAQQTIEMSDKGAEDDLNWSVSENLSSMEEENEDSVTGVQKPSILGDKSLTEIQVREPLIEPPANLLDDGDATINLLASPQEANDALSSHSYLQPQEPQEPQDTPGEGLSQPPSQETEVVGLTPEQMESLIEKQLHQTLEKMVQDLLPSIAEKVVKREIDKMLSDPP